MEIYFLFDVGVGFLFILLNFFCFYNRYFVCGYLVREMWLLNLFVLFRIMRIEMYFIGLIEDESVVIDVFYVNRVLFLESIFLREFVFFIKYRLLEGFC